MSYRLRLPLAGLLPFAMLLNGCSSSPSSSSLSPVGSTISGRVFGGQQPVANATLQLYTVGTSADGSASGTLLPTANPVTTGADGGFNITGKYSCVGATQVYLVATGGNPTPATTNPNLALMTALGACSALTSSTNILVNEMTTVAAVSSLAPFMNSAAAVGSGSGDAAALAAAMATSAALVDPSSGASPGSNVPTGMAVPTAQIATLANVVAACINSSGVQPGTTTLCGQLFSLTTPTNGTAATDTIGALLNLAKNPTLNTPQLFALSSSSPAFQPQLSMAPPDFAVRLVRATSAGYPLQIGPSSLTFASTAAGATSAQQTVYLQNMGSAPITVTSVGLSGTNLSDFGQTNNCTTTLMTGASCTAQVSFTPTTAGLRNAYLSVVSSSPDSPQYVQLSGSATAAPTGAVPQATLSLGLLDFQVVGATRDVILSNTGTGTLTVSSIAAGTTNTRVGNTCGSGVAAGAFCTISITLLQPGSDVVTIMSNDPNGAQTISVTSLMADTASPSNLSFPDTLVASTNTQSFTLSNANNQTVVSFTGPNASDFSAPNPNASNISSSCNVTTQGVGSVCTIQVNFTPSGAGPRSAGMVVSSTGEYIPLSGNGLAVAPSSIATLTPASLSFTDLAQAQTVTLSNYASSPVGIQTITLPSEFSQTNNCGSSLPAQSACSIVVSSTRTFQGGTQGLLTVTGDFGSRTMQLGNHIDPILNFGNLMLSTSGSLSLTSPANLSGSPATYTGSLTGANSGDFTTSSCLNRSGTCSFTTTFSPKAIGIRSAILKASWSAPNNNGSFSQNYLVEGFGVSSPTPGLALSQSSLTSGPSSTTSVSITATNVGTTTLSLGSVAPVFTGANASEFSFSTNACTTLAPGATCSLSLLFTPAPGLNPGLQSANAVFTDVTSGQSFVFPLNVLVTPQPPTISSSVQFPSTQVNVISSPISVTVTAPQSHAVTASINAAYGNVNSSEFSLTKGSCAQGESPCVITLIFHPTVSAYADGGLTVTDNLSGLNTSVSIWGYGGIGVASAGPTSLSFPTRAVGTTSVAQTVSLSNTGGASFNISSIAVTGTNANEFALATSCGTSLAALGNCTIYVSFAPTSSGGKTASLIVSGDANAGLPIAVPITATAQ